jgi:hypothetical protein
LLYESLQGSGELSSHLQLPQLGPIGRDLHALAERRISARLPNWQDLLPDEAFEQS